MNAPRRASAPYRQLCDAFARAEATFNRGDFEAIFALFANNVLYVPPPALSDERADVDTVLGRRNMWGWDNSYGY